MDGNRRWAKKRGLLGALGYGNGGDNIEPVLRMCLKENIECMSIWALAKKNIENRSESELWHIYHLMRNRFEPLVEKLVTENVKLETVGDLSLLPQDIQDLLERSKQKTKHGTKMTFIIALGYGWQEEIIRGIKNLISTNLESGDANIWQKTLEDLNETNFYKYLDTGKFPSVDLVVRTGGDIRHSGYFLYASEYAEYYFTDTLWPDFNEKEFDTALDFYKAAKRNFGK